MTDKPDSIFGNAWDDYAKARPRHGDFWPGDEWGDETLWRQWFERLFGGVECWSRAVEIGQGTGKYSRFVLDGGPAELLAIDVSKVFLDLCADRLRHHIDSGRLHLRQIHESDADALQSAVDAQGWSREVDAVFSIDALVHVPFVQLVSLMLGATEVLKDGGLLVFTFANAESEPGFAKLITDLDRDVRSGLQPTSGTFHWNSPGLIRKTAERMGYAVEICDTDPAHHRDGHFRARFEDPERAARVRAMRASPG